MAKRGYKLQEFVAHSGSVNCLKIGKKNFRQFVTGGDDQVVNLWSIGNPEPVTSLSGHTSPVESVAFDSAEVLVVAGASSGAIKLWDLEEKKMVRTLSGHRSYCTAAEFHPFGEFFATGSMDTNLKMWDIRKKGCIHTYKGHTRGISTIRFSPDGRWVVSGGFDNVIKIWDLTAGKLLHDFKHHEGHIRSIDFHPLEFLLATGSADKTVKFWDLETFEMIGSSRRESAGVRSITFHPDGRTLFCGLDDSLKVYSWEPVICHDSVDMGWSTLGDLCIHDGKLLGGAYFQNSVGVWVADIEFIERCGSVDLRDNPEQKHEHQRVEQWKSNPSMYSTSDVDSNPIKNIYVDCCSPVASKNAGSLDSPNNVIASEIKDTITQSSQKKRSAVAITAKTNVSVDAKYVTVPTIVPCDIPEMKILTSSREESFVSSRASPGVVKPSHVRKLSITKSEMDNKLTSSDPLSLGNVTSTIDPKKDPSLISRLTGNSIAVDSTGEKDPSIKNVEESDKASFFRTHRSQEKGEKAQDFNQGTVPVRVVNGVAVIRGRTRSLVERFEKKEALDITEVNLPDRAPDSNTIATKTSPTEPDRAPNPTIESAQTFPLVPNKAPQTSLPLANEDCHPTTEAPKTSLPVADEDRHPTTEVAKTSLPVVHEDCHTTTEAARTTFPVAGEDCHPTTEPARTSFPVADEECHPTTEAVRTPPAVGRHPTTEAARTSFPVADEECHPTTEAVRTPPGRHPTSEAAKTCTSVPYRGRNPATEAAKITSVPDRGRNPRTRATKTSLSVGDRGRYPTEAASARTSLLVSDRFRQSTSETASAKTSLLVSDRFRQSTSETASARKTLLVSDRFRNPTTGTTRTSLLLPEKGRQPTTEVARTSLSVPERGRYSTTEPATRLSPVPAKTPHPRASEAVLQNVSQLTAGRQESILDDNQIIEALMENHDVLLSTFRSRLTKLQVVRHFWEKKDFKGAINAMTMMPDHALQADVVSVLVERVEIINLDLFSCILPVLLGLLDSTVERHVSVSLEMLLKLTAAFGPLVRSTASAPPLIGVDLHAEERIAMCKQCSAHLDNVQKILPTLIQRGGVVTRSALELNLVLQQA